MCVWGRGLKKAINLLSLRTFVRSFDSVRAGDQRLKRWSMKMNNLKKKIKDLRLILSQTASEE